jgi:hypothetical protein
VIPPTVVAVKWDVTQLVMALDVDELPPGPPPMPPPAMK